MRDVIKPGIDMIVIPGPASQKLGKRVGQLTASKTATVDLKTFPDGETKIRLSDEIEGEEVAIIQSTEPPQDTNLMHLLFLIDTASDLGAKTITAVVPYLAYARQDKRFLTGEAVSIQTVIKLIDSLKVDRFLTLNIHQENVLNKFRVPAESLSAVGLLAAYFRDKGLAGAFSLAPDEGALELAQEANGILRGGSGWLKKERDLYTGEISVEAKEFDVNGRDVCIFDDIISTGGTMADATKMIKEQGARSVYAACVHPLLVGEATDRIMNSGADGIVGTDSISSPVSVVSVAPLIAEALSE